MNEDAADLRITKVMKWRRMKMKQIVEEAATRIVGKK